MKKVLAFFTLLLWSVPFYGQDTPEELRNEEVELPKNS